MRKLIPVAALVAASVLMSGCASVLTPGAGAAIMKDLQGCRRHYEGAIGAGVNGSFRIDCPGPGDVPPTTPPAPS